MRWVKRDSPAMPETRADRSPEGEVSRLRDFPKGNPEERAPVYPWSSGTSVPALLLVSSLISPASSWCTSNPVLMAAVSLHGSPLPFREDPKFLSPAFKTFQDLTPKIASDLQHPSWTPGIPDARQLPQRTLTPIPHLSTRSFSHQNSLRSAVDCQPPTRSSKSRSNDVSSVSLQPLQRV